MEMSLEGSEVILIVVPSNKVEETWKKAKEHLTNQPVIICSKGFNPDLRLLSDVVGTNYNGKVYCLYGPTHAEEVARGLFSGIVLAGEGNLNPLQTAFVSDSFRVDVTHDIVGVQVAASLKNILAIFLGILDGAKLGDNAKAYVMTRGLAEISKVGVHMGGKIETFSGLAGIGDMIVTCVSGHSRNRHVGIQIGKGRNLQEVIDEMNMVAEGVTTVKEAVRLQNQLQIELPLIQGVYDMVYNGKDVHEVLKEI